MIWPPLKAWTSKLEIDGQRHFVAINYWQEKEERWVALLSVLDSNVLIQVSWSNLQDKSKWSCGWDEANVLDYESNNNESEISNNKNEINVLSSAYISLDSGLTIPISKKRIRPWFLDD